LCFRCALRVYTDLRPDVDLPLFLDGVHRDDEWGVRFGFAPVKGLYARVAPITGHQAYAAEVYGVPLVGPYRAGQVLVRGPKRLGTLWLARVYCPSGMLYEVAFPAGRIGGETHSHPDRATHLPASMDTLSTELRVVRDFINQLPRDPGGADRLDPDLEIEAVLTGIRKVAAPGDYPSQERVAEFLYGGRVQDPRDNLKKQLGRIKRRKGLGWTDLQHMAGVD
jgi:hypothetical protein